jgi:hypothetical protein
MYIQNPWKYWKKTGKTFEDIVIRNDLLAVIKAQQIKAKIEK